MNKKKRNNNKIGLALGGGGAKGLAHVGILKVLLREGVDIDYVAGTSIGALVGGHFAAKGEVDSLEGKILAKSDWRSVLSLFDPALTKGVLKGEKIKQLTKTWIEVEDFKELRLPLTIITTDLNTGDAVELDSGDLVTAIRASISVPLVFRPVAYKDKLLTDGGLSNPVPDDAVARMGADKVISVNLDTGYFNDKQIREDKIRLKDITLRSLNILRYNLAQHCLRNSDIVIEPEIDERGLIGWNNFFDPRKAAGIIKQGEKAAVKMLPQIKKKCL